MVATPLSPSEVVTSPETAASTRTLFLAFFAVAGLTLLLDHLAGNITGAWDSTMRMMQVADLFADGNWRDTTWPVMSMPESYISPWSRVVDLPYIFVAKTVGVFTSDTTALRVAFAVVPLAYLMGLLGVCTRLVRRFGGTEKPVMAGVYFISCAVWAVAHFRPYSADHHNIQFLLFAVILWRLLESRDGTRHAGLWLGAATLLSLLVSLESLPLILTGFAVVGLEATLNRRDASLRQLSDACLVIGLAALPAGWLAIGTAALTDGYCDVYNAAYATGLAVGASGVGAWIRVWPRLDPRIHKTLTIKVLGVGAIAIGAGLASLAVNPSCASGPYSFMDPMVQSQWLFQVPQEKTFWTYLATEPGGIKAPAFAFCAMAFTLVALQWKQLSKDARLICIVAAAGLVMSILQVRNLPFFALTIALLLPMAVSTRQAQESKPLIFATLGVGVVLATVILLTPKAKSPGWYAQQEFHCGAEAFAFLSTETPGSIAAPVKLSHTMLMSVGGNLGSHTLGQLGYHRMDSGKLRQMTGFLSQNTKVRADMFAPYDYLVMCAPLPAELTRNPVPVGEMTGAAKASPLQAALDRGEVPDFLDPIAGAPATTHIFRIKRETP